VLPETINAFRMGILLIVLPLYEPNHTALGFA